MSVRYDGTEKNTKASQLVPQASTASATPEADAFKNRKQATSNSEDDGARNLKRQKRTSPVEVTSGKDAAQAMAQHTENHLSSGSTQFLSEADESKRDLYRRRVFLPRLNRILKAVGKHHVAGKCNKWATVRTRLKDAGVTAKWRNAFLLDFCKGYEIWDANAGIDTNSTLAHFAATFRNRVSKQAEQGSLITHDAQGSPSSVLGSASTSSVGLDTPSRTETVEGGGGGGGGGGRLGHYDEIEIASVIEPNRRIPTDSSPKLEVPASGKERPSVEIMRESLEIDISDGEKRLKELAETMAAIAAANAARKEALKGVNSIVAARAGLDKTFEYMPPESRARMVAAMSDVAERALWEEHSTRLPGPGGY